MRSSSASRDQSNPTVGANFGSNTLGTTVSGRQPLFNRANRVTIAQSERTLDSSLAELDTAEQDLILRVSQAYFDVLGAQDTLQTTRASKAAISEQLASARRNFEVGTATITDTREAQARFDLATAQEIAAERGAILLSQFDNPANPAMHECTTAEEIWADTGGEVDAVVGGIGTGGTLTGIARALKPRRSGLLVIGVEPAESAVLNGDDPGPHRIQGIGAGFHPGVLELDRLDCVERVAEREAFAAARSCARTEGVAVGISSGAALYAAVQVAQRPENAGKLIVTIIPSFGERYLTSILYADLLD